MPELVIICGLRHAKLYWPLQFVDTQEHQKYKLQEKWTDDFFYVSCFYVFMWQIFAKKYILSINKVFTTFFNDQFLFFIKHLVR